MGLFYCQKHAFARHPHAYKSLKPLPRLNPHICTFTLYSLSISTIVVV